MNQLVFGIKNVKDKISKSIFDFTTLKFYLKIYIFDKIRKQDFDIVIISYPKCGRTWVRILLSKYAEQMRFDQKKLSKDYLRLYLNIVKFDHGQGNWVPFPKKIKKLKFNHKKYKNNKILFLVRDPRDVLVSSWYHLKYRENIFKKDLSFFIRDELIGIDKIIAFMNLWIENSGNVKDFKLLSYEQLKKDSFRYFKELLEFFVEDVDEEKLMQAISDSSFEKMRKTEISGDLKEPWMLPGRNNFDNSLKVRKGRVGGYKEEMTEADIKFVNRKIRENLREEIQQCIGIKDISLIVNKD